MSLSDESIDDLKPTADLQEQSRPAEEEPDDPEAPVSPGPVDGITADPLDAADQRREVPLDDEEE